MPNNRCLQYDRISGMAFLCDQGTVLKIIQLFQYVMALKKILQKNSENICFY